jgi:hypothetical protein
MDDSQQSFTQPNLPALIREIAATLLQEKEQETLRVLRTLRVSE